MLTNAAGAAFGPARRRKVAEHVPAGPGERKGKA
jgi:hypothetical protein